MNQDFDFDLPDFVRTADSSQFDTNVAGSFSVGGYRLDNRAAVWQAAAAMRKSAGDHMGSHLHQLIDQACDLFGITEDMFVLKKASADDRTITITDGDNVASFCIVDKETLDAAADSVLEKRASLPYGFAHDCAQTVFIMSQHLGIPLSGKADVELRKIAGELEVDFNRGRTALLNRAARADQFHMPQEAEVLRKLANICTDKCDPELARLFVMAADEFDRGLSDLQKRASGIHKGAEDDFYMTPVESIQKKANEELNIDGFNRIKRSSLEGIATLGISKWASELGYEISSSDSPEAIIQAVGKMPKALREEFVNLFA